VRKDGLREGNREASKEEEAVGVVVIVFVVDAIHFIVGPSQRRSRSGGETAGQVKGTRGEVGARRSDQAG